MELGIIHRHLCYVNNVESTTYFPTKCPLIHESIQPRNKPTYSASNHTHSQLHNGGGSTGQWLSNSTCWHGNGDHRCPEYQ